MRNDADPQRKLTNMGLHHPQNGPFVNSSPRRLTKERATNFKKIPEDPGTSLQVKKSPKRKSKVSHTCQKTVTLSQTQSLRKQKVRTKNDRSKIPVGGGCSVSEQLGKEHITRV